MSSEMVFLLNNVGFPVFAFVLMWHLNRTTIKDNTMILKENTLILKELTSVMKTFRK